MRRALSKLPLRYRYTLHNVVGHPLMGLLQLVGADELAEAAHWYTLPLKEVDIEDSNRKGHRGRKAQEWQQEKDAAEWKRVKT